MRAHRVTFYRRTAMSRELPGYPGLRASLAKATSHPLAAPMPLPLWCIARFPTWYSPRVSHRVLSNIAPPQPSSFYRHNHSDLYNQVLAFASEVFIGYHSTSLFLARLFLDEPVYTPCSSRKIPELAKTTIIYTELHHPGSSTLRQLSQLSVGILSMGSSELQLSSFAYPFPSYWARHL